jgi:hypothetical protein
MSNWSSEHKRKYDEIKDFSMMRKSGRKNYKIKITNIMSLSNIGLIIFFGVYGINAFWGFPQLHFILGITALFIAVTLALKK